MTAATATERRCLPRGWGDLLLQLAIWFGFLAAYQVARGVADRNPGEAFDNGLKVIDIERRASGLWELSLQSYAHRSDVLTWSVSATYWLSQFTVMGLALLWVYLRRNESFIALPQRDHARERARARRLRAAPDRAAAHVPGARLRGHARRPSAASTTAAG